MSFALSPWDSEVEVNDVWLRLFHFKSFPTVCWLSSFWIGKSLVFTVQLLVVREVTTLVIIILTFRINQILLFLMRLFLILLLFIVKMKFHRFIRVNISYWLLSCLKMQHFPSLIPHIIRRSIIGCLLLRLFQWGWFCMERFFLLKFFQLFLMFNSLNIQSVHQHENCFI